MFSKGKPSHIILEWIILDRKTAWKHASKKNLDKKEPKIPPKLVLLLLSITLYSCLKFAVFRILIHHVFCQCFGLHASFSARIVFNLHPTMLDQTLTTKPDRAVYRPGLTLLELQFYYFRDWAESGQDVRVWLEHVQAAATAGGGGPDYRPRQCGENTVSNSDYRAIHLPFL